MYAHCCSQETRLDFESAPSTAQTDHAVCPLLKVATEKALNLPPVQQDLSFLRLSLVLAELCLQVYAAARGQVADSLEILVPKAGALASPAKIAIQLLHFRCGATSHSVARVSIAQIQDTAQA